MVYDEKEIIELAQYYLDNEEEREKIAAKGYEKVINNHTFKQRAKQVYDAIRIIMILLQNYYENKTFCRRNTCLSLFHHT